MEVDVEFLDTPRGAILSVNLDSTMTAKEAISELISAGFIPEVESGYHLKIKGGNDIELNQSLENAGVVNGATIRIIPILNSGGYKSTTNSGAKFSIPGLTEAPSKEFDINEIAGSPDAIHMIIHLYQDEKKENLELKKKIEEQRTLIETESKKSNNRLVASVLLLVSQVIVGIGANLLNTQPTIGLLVLIAGFIQALGAIYLNFSKNVFLRNNRKRAF